MKGKIVLILLSLLVGLIIGIVIDKFILNNISNINSQKEIHLNKGKLINPLLQCELADNLGGRDHAVLEEEIYHMIQDYKKSGFLEQGAVYFRDLNNGPWFGVNDDIVFSPASLLKVPLMIAIFKEAEKNPDLLNQEIKIEKVDDVNNQFFFSRKEIVVGKSYMVKDLVKRMIIYSDNKTVSHIFGLLSGDAVLKAEEEMGLISLKLDKADDFMTVKEYSSIFRILYNASYLNREMSEQALEILSKTEFKGGIQGKLPKNIPVAHKFGERELESNSFQLHDCGIVYYPNKPYLICIMTRGSDMNKLLDVISKISEKVYKEVSAK